MENRRAIVPHRSTIPLVSGYLDVCTDDPNGFRSSGKLPFEHFLKNAVDKITFTPIFRAP
jgi:hypothetical protein